MTNLGEHDIHVTPSIGFALFPRDGQDVDSLCRHADARELLVQSTLAPAS